MPKGTLGVLWAVSLARAGDDLGALEALLAKVDPTIRDSLRSDRAGRHLFDAALADAAGIDRSASLSIVPGEAPGTMVVSFGLADRPKFLAWLQKEGEVHFVPFDGEQAAVLNTANTVPWACVTHADRAYCQLGASGDDAPLVLLGNVIHAKDETKPSPAIRAALDGLPKDATWYGVFEPSSWVDFGVKRRSESERQKNRFEPKKTKKSLDGQLKAEEHRWRRAAKAFDGGAFSLRRSDSQVELEVQVGLTSIGLKALEDATPKRATRGVLERWAETPALLHGVMHLDPHFAAEVLRAVEGPALPLDALDGSLALLVLGVDCDCEAAKKKGQVAPLDWAFLFPSAFAIGLTSKAASAPELAPLPDQASELEVAPAATPKRTIVRSTPNGRLELQVLEDALIYSAGPGSAAAALRRFNALPAPKSVAEGREAHVDLTIHLKSIDAALSAGSLGFEHRSELLMFEALRLKARPLIETIDEIKLEARPSPDRQRLRFKLSLGKD